MFQARFTIWVRTKAGEEFAAFTWTRDERSGVERAKAEAPRFGHDLDAVWAVPIEA